MKKMFAVIAASCAMALPVAVHAEVINFAPFASGNTGSSSLTAGIATINVTGGTVFVYRPGDFGQFPGSGGLCALNAGFKCETDWTLTFSTAVSNLIFFSEGFDTGDNMLITAFNGATNVGTQTVTSNRSINFGSTTITRLVFDDSSIGAGFGFGDFSFDRVNTTVPEPTTLALVGLALAGLAAARRRAA